HAGTAERVKVTEAEVIYVAIDADRRKIKINKDAIKGDFEQHETS
ncbi:MAG: hypothetical protein H0T45_10065, partial [Pyrinomonadaceae bacterium]|nr:hypothetical protein [Pyrinomonadaceae bacterium]